MKRSVLWLVLAAVLLAGCSGIRPYTDGGERNLRIETKTSSGSFLSSVSAAVDIHSVGADCRTGYMGTIDLDSSTVETGIPVDRASYMVFVFSSSSFLANSRGSISQSTLLRPRPGHRYEIQVSYMDDIYNVGIREVNMRTSKGRDIDLVGLEACSPL